MGDVSKYTCKDYRLERYLLALKMRLKDNKLDEHEKREIEEEIEKVEKQMGL